jgi:hypothetical protein
LERELDIPGSMNEARATTATVKKTTSKITHKTTTTSSSSSTFRMGSSTDDSVADSAEPCVNGTRTSSGEPCSSSGDKEDQDQKQIITENLQPVLRTFPEALEMYLLTSSSDSPITKTSGNISITNVGTENVTLMESSIGSQQNRKIWTPSQNCFAS